MKPRAGPREATRAQRSKTSCRIVPGRRRQYLARSFGRNAMTLIACLHPQGCRTLLADVLVSSPEFPSRDPILPSRRYISLEQLRAMPFRPVALRRKVIEITPSLVALWAGDYGAAKSFAERITVALADVGKAEAEQAVEAFMYAHYRDPVNNFFAIIVPDDTAWFYRVGPAVLSASAFAGEYLVAGSGTAIFRNYVDRKEATESPIIAADVQALGIANDLMAQEIFTGATIQANFGASFEVIYRAETAFERVDDVMHFFNIAQVQGSNIQLHHYPHALRQWYEGTQLCIASYSTPEANGQGLPFTTFAVPSILEEPRPPSRVSEDFAIRPRYLCVHHVFDFGDKHFVPANVIMRGDAIDENFRLSRDGDALNFTVSERYVTLLHNLAAKSRKQPSAS